MLHFLDKTSGPQDLVLNNIDQFASPDLELPA